MAVNTQDINKIIQGDAAVLVRVAEALGKDLAEKKLATNQIRNIFGAIRRVELRWQATPEKSAGYEEVILLQPKLAYYTKRTPAMAPLKENLNVAIDELKKDKSPDENHFRNFIRFCEAIVAYHRAYSERD